MNLFAASQQWASRPADERFESLESMYDACRHYYESADETTAEFRKLTAAADRGEVVLRGAADAPAKLTHWAFGQLANKVGAPADYLRRLPAQLAATNLNHGLQNVASESPARLLFHRNGSLVCRAATSEKYSRIWNHEVVARLLPLKQHGWRVPPARPAFEGQPGARPATEADVLADREGGGGLSINVGDMIAPAGLYASSHDMFAFMVNEATRIDDGSAGGLSRGFFITNSEVGAASLKLTRFLYRHVCGNHIVWGAESVQEIRVIHRGAADERFAHQIAVELRKYANESASEDEARIVAAKRCYLANSKDELLDLLFGRKVLPRKTLEAAYESAEVEAAEHAAGNPRTAWGFANGITRMSQATPFADERNRLDRAAGKVLEMAF